MKGCNCEPYPDLGEDGPEHDGDCPRNYDHLHTAEDIAAFRQYIMVWAEGVGELSRKGDPFFHNHREVAARMAAGVTARAVELGLEQP